MVFLLTFLFWRKKSEMLEQSSNTSCTRVHRNILFCLLCWKSSAWYVHAVSEGFFPFASPPSSTFAYAIWSLRWLSLCEMQWHTSARVLSYKLQNWSMLNTSRNLLVHWTLSWPFCKIAIWSNMLWFWQQTALLCKLVKVGDELILFQGVSLQRL